MMADIELFAARIGCYLLLDKAYVEWPGTPEDQRRAHEISREIMKRIRESPIVVEEPEGELGGRVFWMDAPISDEKQPKRSNIHFSNYVSFKVHWPRKNQELFYYSGAATEDFLLTYDGTIYMITAQCNSPLDRPYSFSFGREGWRILDVILGSSDLWDLEIIGPSPMFPLFYVAFADEPTNFSLGRELIREGDTLESLLVLPGSAIADSVVAVRDVLQRLRHPARMHYMALLTRLEFLHEHRKLYSHFLNATKLYQETVQAFPRDPRKWLQRLELNRKLRESVGLAYTHYAQLEEARAEANEWVRDTTETFSRDPLLEPHRAYTSDQLTDVLNWSGQHVLEGLRFFAEESRSRSVEFATLEGALIGGIIVIVVTLLALLLS